MRTAFLHPDHDERLWELVKQRKQQLNEIAVDYIYSKRTMASEISRDIPIPALLRELTSGFLPDIRAMFEQSPPTDLSDLLNKAKRFELCCSILQESNQLRNAASQQKISKSLRSLQTTMKTMLNRSKFSQQIRMSQDIGPGCEGTGTDDSGIRMLQ